VYEQSSDSGSVGCLPDRREPLPPVRVFVLTRAVNGVLVSAAHETAPYLGTPEFEDELVRLVRSFLESTPSGAVR
ncbi:MAG: hypothetical protein ABI823_21355, partial [Bryobacteraceae bacterium]